MKSHAAIKDQLHSYYQSKKQEPADFAKMGWKSLHAQNVRFQQLTRSFSLKYGDSVNDLGCGIGNFYGYLKQEFPGLDLRYAGYDMIGDMISEASKKFQNDQRAAFFKIETVQDIKPADYTFASGIFNLKFSISEKQWLSYILETIRTMSLNSSKGISFNCLTSYSDKEFMREELYYPDPLFIFDFCKKEISRNVALYHDYNEYDFTIAVAA